MTPLNSSAKGAGNMNAGTEIAELEITDLARGGAGVARGADGRVVFVPFSAPGDRVRVRIVESSKRYAQGELIEVLQPSPIRVEPRCVAFAKCGGCEWQHLPYSEQWKTKVRGVKHALSRAALEIPLWEEFPAEQVWEYRNRVQARGNSEGLGFFARGSRECVPVERCEIARPEINAAWEQTRREGQKLAASFKVEMEVLTDGRLRKTWNSRHGAAGFRQVHDAQNAKLQTLVASWLTPGRRLYDLFGGSGNLSRGLVASMSGVTCVDVGAPAEAGPIEFVAESVSKWSRKVLKFGPPVSSGSAPASAILDPPREGLGEDASLVLEALDRLRIREAVAVGCDPDAWVRDLRAWVAKGWKVERAAVLDLFPQTAHVESIARLTKSE